MIHEQDGSMLVEGKVFKGGDSGFAGMHLQLCHSAAAAAAATAAASASTKVGVRVAT
jgi:hypothetical protein